MNEENRKWLVKSNSLVVGPYHFDEVVEAIFKGDIHVLDEIKGPFERWRPIRDHSLFAAAIEKLKATTFATRENTITENIDAFTQTGTMELTQTETDSILRENTVTSEILPGQNTSSAPTVSVSTPREEQHYPPNQQSIKINRKQASRFPFAFIMTVVIIISGVIVLKFGDIGKPESDDAANEQLFNDYTDKGLALLKIGEYEQSLKNFSRASELNAEDPALILEMAPLLVQIDSQYGEVENKIENLLAKKFQKEYMSRGKNIVGMSFSYRKQNEEALAEINKSLEVDGQYYSALLNKGYQEIKLNRGRKAIETLSKAVQNSPKEAIGIYLLTRAFVEDGLRRKDSKMFEEALSISNKFSQDFFDFQQEVLFFRAIAEKNLGVAPEELTRSVRTFLSVDPELTRLHVHQISWDFQSFNWSEFMGFCRLLASGIDQYTSRLLLNFCQYKSGKTLKAKNGFQNLLLENGKDGILRALHTSSLFALNDNELAKNALSFIGSVTQEKFLAEILLRGCLQIGDIACVQKVVRSNPGSRVMLLYSYWAMIEMNSEIRKREAGKALTQGLKLSPYFGPFLKMRGRL